MPHFGLVDHDELSEVDAAHLRARLHVRSGRRRLREGRLLEALGTLYDSLQYGMRWAILVGQQHGAFDGLTEADLWDDELLYSALLDVGVFRRDLVDLDAFDPVFVADAGNGDVDEDEAVRLAAQVAEALTMIGILPFDEGALPPESPDPAGE